MTKRRIAPIVGAVLLAAGLLAAPYSVWLTALTWAAAFFLLGLAEAEHGALTYFLPALAAGIWCALARWSGAALVSPLGALLLLLCAGLGGMALLRGKGWGLDGAQAVGFAAMLLLAARAQALQLALRPTAEGSQAAFTALQAPARAGTGAGPGRSRAACGARGRDIRRPAAGHGALLCQDLPAERAGAAGGAALCGPSGVDKRRGGA